MGIGGTGGIRTHGTITGPAVFKTAALDHSATVPSAFLVPVLGFAKTDLEGKARESFDIVQLEGEISELLIKQKYIVEIKLQK